MDAKLREVTSFCRVCSACCGTRLTIDAQDRIVSIRGDKAHPVSKGYACFKGLQAEDVLLWGTSPPVLHATLGFLASDRHAH